MVFYAQSNITAERQTDRQTDSQTDRETERVLVLASLSRASMQ